MFKKIILIFILFFSFFIGINNTFAVKSDYDANIKIDRIKASSNISWVNKYLNIIKDKRDNDATKTWKEWFFALFENIAKTIKNIVYVVAWIFFIVEVLILFFSSNTEEEVNKFKQNIIWISIWIMTMQIAYSFTSTLFDKDIEASLAATFSDWLIYPAIQILRYMASFLFLTMAIYAFYRFVTAHWEEESVKKWKYTIIQAIIWFFMVKVVEFLVTSTYWQVVCSNVLENKILWDTPNPNSTFNNCITAPDPTWNVELLLKTVNWVNWFVWLITLLFIIWAWWLILFSNWEEDKMKKAKQIIIYIIIWVVVLVMSYLILNFFIWAQEKWLIK